MKNGPRIIAFSPARYKLVSSALVRLTATGLFIAALPSCALLDPSNPYGGVPRRVLSGYGLAPGPTASPTLHPTTRAVEAPITLATAVEIALDNNPELAAAHYSVDAAKAQRDVAVGAVLPKINLQGGYTYFREDRLIKPRRPGTLKVLGFTDELVTGNIVLTMPLYTGGRLRNQVKVAELIAQSTKQQLLRSRTELVFNVSSVFYSILGHQEVINSIMFSRRTLLEHHKRAKQMFDAQKAAKVDLLRTKVRLADIEQQVIRERNVLNIKRFYLANLLGLSKQDKLLQIQGELGLSDAPANLGEGLTRTLANRQDYQSLKSKIDAQQKNLDIAKARRLPEVRFRASYGNQWAADSHDKNEVGEVGVFAVIPIFEGGRIEARIRRERSRLRAQKERLRKLELHIRLEMETARSNIESTRARVSVTQQAVEQGKESLRIERAKYELGKGAIVDVLDAQSALLNSQMNYYRALADYNTALAQFRLAVGEKQ